MTVDVASGENTTVICRLKTCNAFDCVRTRVCLRNQADVTHGMGNRTCSSMRTDNGCRRTQHLYPSRD
jgi:hypothetical protein